MTKKVTFASTISSTNLVPSYTSKRNWYSMNERSQFLLASLREARRLRMILARINEENLAQEDLYEHVGIEKYLSPTLLRMIDTHKQAHIETILASQNRLLGVDSNSEEILRQASESISRWAKARARELALRYNNDQFVPSKND